MDNRIAQQFVVSFFDVLKDMVGVEPVRQIIESKFVAKGISVDSSGDLQIPSTVSYESLQSFIKIFVKRFSNDYGESFLEHTIETLFKRIQDRNGTNEHVRETIFDLVPHNFLLVEKVRQLSRTELEKAQIELSRVNSKLEVLNGEFVETTKVLVRRDIELTHSNERLRDLDAVKSQFVSVAAHQLRTPLTGIKWTLHALLEEHVGKLNHEQKKYSQDAYKSTVRLISLINDLLDAARLEEGKFGFVFETQKFDPLVRRIFESFEKTAKDKGIRYTLRIRKAEFPAMSLDKEKIGIVLENLIDNAIKYTAPAGSVTVTLSQKEDRVICEVKDTGIGMPKDQTAKIFSKFFRAENAQLYQTSGTGLGLFLAKNIVEHHKGIMFFETQENKGSTFAFSLPILKNNKETL